MTIKYFSYCVIALTLLFILGWSSVSVTQATFINWLVSLLILYYCFTKRKEGMRRFASWDNGLLNLYLLWLFFNVIRGAIIADNYWEYKNLIGATITLLLPVTMYVFVDAIMLKRTLLTWFRYIIPVFMVFLIWIHSTEGYHYTLAPIFLLGIFIPIIPKKWRWVFIVILGLSTFIRLDARSQVIKAVVVILFAIAFYYRRYITTTLFKFGYSVAYIVPVVLLYLGISGIFNIFADVSESESGKYTTTTVRNGEVVDEDLSSDTRSFIYIEVINSALDHNYVIWGRTPAQGNDSEAFGTFTAEELHTGKYERSKNELCHPNVFTWLGLIGMVMYSLFYMRSSYLCLFHSRSQCMKFVGLFVGFHWAFGWVEEINRFEIDNLAIWMSIAMGLSKQFRAMSDAEFIAWVRSIFVRRKRHPAWQQAPLFQKRLEQSQLQNKNNNV